MRSVPRVLGPDTSAVRVSLQEASQAQQDGDQVRLSRAWKFFSLWHFCGDLPGARRPQSRQVSHDSREIQTCTFQGRGA